MSKRETMTEKLRRMNAERLGQDLEVVGADQIPDATTEESRATENTTATPPSISEESSKSEYRISEIRNSDVHPGQGGRGDFLKVTVTMDPDDFESINAEMVRRKRAKEKGAQLSGCIREAIRFWRAAGMPRQE